MVRSCRACNGGLRQWLGGGRGRLGPCAAGSAALREDIWRTGFFASCGAFQCRSSVGAGLDCKVVARRRVKVVGLLSGGREGPVARLVLALFGTASFASSHKNQTSNDVSTSLSGSLQAKLWYKRGSVALALRQNTGVSRRVRAEPSLIGF